MCVCVSWLDKIDVECRGALSALLLLQEGFFSL